MDDNGMQTNLKNEENENKNEIINNKEEINNSEKIKEDSKQTENTINFENSLENIKENENDKQEGNIKKLLDYERKLKEIQDINNSLNIKISVNENNFLIIKNEKINLEKINNQLESNIKILKESYEKSISEKEIIISKNKSEMKKLQKNIDSINNKNTIINQATKQIFLQYLTNDIYIEQIEKCFNNQDMNKYFDTYITEEDKKKTDVYMKYN